MTHLSYAWPMPSADTFSVPPIKDLLARWLGREFIGGAHNDTICVVERKAA